MLRWPDSVRGKERRPEKDDHKPAARDDPDQLNDFIERHDVSRNSLLVLRLKVLQSTVTVDTRGICCGHDDDRKTGERHRCEGHNHPLL